MFLSLIAFSTNAPSAPGAGSVSLFRSHTYSAPWVSAWRIPTLLPPAKPRFFEFSSSKMSGRAARILATESFAEPLSTTMILRHGYVHFANESRQLIVSRQPFQFKTMQAICGFALNGNCFPSPEIDLARYAPRRWPVHQVYYQSNDADRRKQDSSVAECGVDLPSVCRFLPSSISSHAV